MCEVYKCHAKLKECELDVVLIAVEAPLAAHPAADSEDVSKQILEHSSCCAIIIIPAAFDIIKYVFRSPLFQQFKQLQNDIFLRRSYDGAVNNCADSILCLSVKGSRVF